MDDDRFVSKLPRMMLIELITQLLEYLKAIHLLSLKGIVKTENSQDIIDEINETFIKPENMVLMITAKALNNIMNEPEEMKLAIEEMIKFEEYYKKDLSDTDAIILDAELDIVLHKMGIKRGKDARD
jgi:hypothetical protein